MCARIVLVVSYLKKNVDDYGTKTDAYCLSTLK